MSGNEIAGKIHEDLKMALKSGDRIRTSSLRMLMSDLKNAQLAEGAELDEEKETAVISSYARKCRESLEEFRKGGRDDLVDRAEKELQIVMSYLPEQFDEEKVVEELKKVIEETSASGTADLGKVMGVMMSRFKGRVDGKLVKEKALDVLESGQEKS